MVGERPSGRAASAPVVVMGVAGAGKTTVGVALAERFGARFLDADAAHPAGNVAKMAAGHPLSDDDRWPWLARLRAELRRGDVVITCSALRRSYRDLLRRAVGVRFVYLALDAGTARARAAARPGHFMGPAMIDSQFAALEPPQPDETDVLTVDATASPAEVIDAIERGLVDVTAGLPVEPLLVEAGPDRALTGDDLTALVEGFVHTHVMAGAPRRVLLVPPDHTRLHAAAGPITVALLRALERAGCEVGVLPALGTHAAMSGHDARLMFGDDIPASRLLYHDWRNGLRVLGEIGAAEVEVLSDGRFAEPIPVAVDAELLAGWDLVVSVGQVVPHEVIGMANFTKNLIVGLGGAATIHRSHFLGAVTGMEHIMGRACTAVRDAVDAAFDRFVAPHVNVMWMLTVVEDVAGEMQVRGLFAGAGGSMGSGGAAFRAAATLAQRVNVQVVEQPFERIVCWLDPAEFRSTWLGNKAVYRTRMAIADGGELIVLGPGVVRFGEDPAIDALIRRHGYRGTAAVLLAVAADADLAANLAAAAHLIHGSSEDRFSIVWCTDPATGGLTRDEVEAVGYEWRDLPGELVRLGIDATTPSGRHVDPSGVPFDLVANPAMGLWSTAARLA
jgi:carbohydrate kinase (thermoresistant glucokinase family)